MHTFRSHQKSGMRRRFGRFAWGLLCVWGLLWGAACLHPEQILSRYVQLNINGLHADIRYLKVQLAPCGTGSGAAGAILTQERVVTLPFGGELFYLPLFTGGTFDIKVLGYRSQTDERVLQHVRSILTLESSQKILPTLSLVAGSPSKERDWCDFYEPPPPTREVPFSWDEKIHIPGGGGTLPGLPPIDVPSSSIPVPPPPAPSTPASEFRNQDQLEWREPIGWPDPVTAVATSGRLAIVANIPKRSLIQTLNIFDVVDGRTLHQIVLPSNCEPRGLDVQGTICAVACRQLDRVFFYSIDTGEAFGPPVGIAVGKKPTAVRISGDIVAVANRDSHDVTLFRLGRWEDTPKTYAVGESPQAITAVNGHFFVANALSGTVTSFRVDSTFEIHDDSSYQVGKLPLGLAANGMYMVTANAGSANITIWDWGRDARTSRTLYIGGVPRDVVLLSHTAIISDMEARRLAVVDLQLGKVIQVVPMTTSIEKLAFTGEWLLMSSPDGGVLARASLKTRPSLVQLRVGTSLHQVHIHQGKAWVFDPLAGQMNVIDLRQRQVEKRVSLESDGKLLLATEKWLLHTDAQQHKLVIRPLHNLRQIVAQQSHNTPIRTGRIVSTYDEQGNLKTQTAYLLHWETEDTGSVSAAFVSQVNLLQEAEKHWELSIPTRLAFADRPLEPVDILPWDEKTVLIADQRVPALYLLDAQQFTHIRTLDLSSRPVRMERVGQELALTLDNGSLLLIKVPSLEKQPPIQLSTKQGALGQMREFNGLLAIVDRLLGQILFFEPSSRKIITRIGVGCGPADVGFWHNSADASPWRHLLVVPNFCGESLSLSPLRLGSYTR